MMLALYALVVLGLGDPGGVPLLLMVAEAGLEVDGEERGVEDAVLLEVLVLVDLELVGREFGFPPGLFVCC